MIGLESESLVQVAFEVGGLLAWDPVDEIQGDVVNLGTTKMADRPADVVRLSPALQHVQEPRLEALHAQRDSSDLVLGENVRELRSYRLGVRLDRHLARTGQRPKQAVERLRLGERGCAASEEDGFERLGQDASLQLELAEESVDVPRVLLRPPDQRDEVAVAAAMGAKRQVDVEMADAFDQSRHERRSPFRLSTARNASCGISTVPTCFIRFFPFFCRSRSLRLRLMSPP